MVPSGELIIASEPVPRNPYEQLLAQGAKGMGTAIQEGYQEYLNEQLEESPFDEKLLQRQLELFEKLGLHDRWSERVRLHMRMRESRIALPQ